MTPAFLAAVARVARTNFTHLRVAPAVGDAFPHLYFVGTVDNSRRAQILADTRAAAGMHGVVGPVMFAVGSHDWFSTVESRYADARSVCTSCGASPAKATSDACDACQDAVSPSSPQAAHPTHPEALLSDHAWKVRADGFAAQCAHCESVAHVLLVVEECGALRATLRAPKDSCNMIDARKAVATARAWFGEVTRNTTRRDLVDEAMAAFKLAGTSPTASALEALEATLRRVVGAIDDVRLSWGAAHLEHLATAAARLPQDTTPTEVSGE